MILTGTREYERIDSRLSSLDIQQIRHADQLERLEVGQDKIRDACDKLVDKLKKSLNEANNKNIRSWCIDAAVDSYKISGMAFNEKDLIGRAKEIENYVNGSTDE